MKFREGTTVKTVDGDKVGTIDNIVIDPTDNKVSHIVVEKGFLFTEDRVVPVEALREADDETVVLEASVEDIKQFPEFEADYYVAPEASNLPSGWDNWGAAPMYYYPPVGVGTRYTAYPLPAATAVKERTARNIPMENIAIDEGTKVTTDDGEHAGDVEEVFTNDDGEVTHLLISKGFIFETERLIPITWVRTMNESEIRLNVPTRFVEDLPEYTS